MPVNPPFDPVKAINFGVALAWYGQDCIWSSNSGDIAGSVLFNDPTKETRFSITGGRGLSHVGYMNGEIDANTCYIEYPKGAFEGLYDLVQINDINQYISTGGVRYVCIKTSAVFDGSTYRIYLQQSETQ